MGEDDRSSCLEYQVYNGFDTMANQIAGKTKAVLTIIETAIFFVLSVFLKNSCLNIWQL